MCGFIAILLMFFAIPIIGAWSVRHHGTYKAVEHEDGTYTLLYNYRGEWLEDSEHENYESLLNTVYRKGSNKLSVPTTPV